jgi:hypothetical protein
LIEVGEGDDRLVVVVENKIDAKDSQGQLDDYASWAHGRSSREPLLIYLTPKGDPATMVRRPSQWVSVSYMSLLVQWRRVLRDEESTPGPWVEVLRLYLATLTKHICKVRPRGGAPLSEQVRMIEYLRAATGGCRSHRTAPSSTERCSGAASQVSIPRTRDMSSFARAGFSERGRPRGTHCGSHAHPGARAMTLDRLARLLACGRGGADHQETRSDDLSTRGRHKAQWREIPRFVSRDDRGGRERSAAPPGDPLHP